MRALAVGLLCAACSSPTLAERAPNPAPAPKVAATTGVDVGVASCVDDEQPFSEAAMRARLAFLASEKLDGRAAGSEGDKAARAMIAERMSCLGLTPAGDDGTFQQAFDDTANVVGYIPGKDPSQIILIGAHSDHLGEGHLGANDNASGVTTLLAIAQSIRQRKEQPSRTIAFVTFGAEEPGTLGSIHFAAHPPKALPIENIVYDINIDMVGTHASRGFVAAMGTLPKTPARTILDKLVKTRKTLSVGLGGRGARSDHTAFCKQGIPYVFFWTPDKRCYHEACDTVDNIDFKHMTEIAAMAGDLVHELAETDVDLAKARNKLGCK